MRMKQGRYFRSNSSKRETSLLEKNEGEKKKRWNITFFFLARGSSDSGKEIKKRKEGKVSAGMSERCVAKLS